jgi:hypothetical protein
MLLLPAHSYDKYKCLHSKHHMDKRLLTLLVVAIVIVTTVLFFYAITATKKQSPVQVVTQVTQPTTITK